MNHTLTTIRSKAETKCLKCVCEELTLKANKKKIILGQVQNEKETQMVCEHLYLLSS